MNDNDSDSRPASLPRSRLLPVGIGACLCILAVLAGLLALSSCATTSEGLAREERLLLGMSNAVVAVRAATPFIPQPASGTIEALLAAATAGLAAWSTHLHRSISVLNNGGPKRKPPPEADT